MAPGGRCHDGLSLGRIRVMRNRSGTMPALLVARRRRPSTIFSMLRGTIPFWHATAANVSGSASGTFELPLGEVVSGLRFLTESTAPRTHRPRSGPGIPRHYWSQGF
jgi:hypothetical protein